MICLAEEMYKALVSSIAIIRNIENKALESSISQAYTRNSRFIQENHQGKFYRASVSSTRVSRTESSFKLYYIKKELKT